jgi:hypothetical protein
MPEARSDLAKKDDQKRILFAVNLTGILHCKKSLKIFPFPAGMSLTKLSLAGKNFIISGQGEYV